MRPLISDCPQEVAGESAQYRGRAGENPSEYYEYAETGQAYDEYCEGYEADVEYRYADFPLALGQAIMMNHACSRACSIGIRARARDDPFHNNGLHYLLRFGVKQRPITLHGENIHEQDHLSPAIANAR
jgi:hypothetical protein